MYRYASVVHFGRAISKLLYTAFIQNNGDCLNYIALATAMYIKKNLTRRLCASPRVYLTQTMVALSVWCVGGGVIHLFLHALIAEITNLQ